MNDANNYPEFFGDEVEYPLNAEELAEMEAAYAAMDARDNRLPTPEEVAEAARALGLDEVPF